ncbi:hypothetical protein SLEP1_g48776 [Rubroshorea leprosula]|uniref:Uncharacterized protein n=1 Tax=Rubroshorea leprosula TaxID=152421 RepID=A0AAV5LUM3_9ROSI|nr:hypothetical protein SLEP1_g48776 [Rubroshorea leprosula]
MLKFLPRAIHIYLLSYLIVFLVHHFRNRNRGRGNQGE